MEGWGALAAPLGGHSFDPDWRPGAQRDADEPDEQSVPFIFRLSNEGRAIVGQMRKINYMVRTEKAYTAWRNEYLRVKGKDSLQNRLNQQTKLAEGKDSDHVEEEPQGVDSYLALDIALVGDTNIQQALSRHGVHHHYLDGSLHFEHGILSIQKYVHTCHHAFFKIFGDKEVDLGAIVTAHRNAKSKKSAPCHRTLTLTCWTGIEYQGVSSPSPKGTSELSITRSPVANSTFKLWANSLRDAGTIRRRFLFRYEDCDRKGQLTNTHHEVSAFLQRVHEVCESNEKHFSQLRGHRTDIKLDLSAADKRKAGSVPVVTPATQHVKQTEFQGLAAAARSVNTIQRAYRTLKNVMEIRRQQKATAKLARDQVQSDRDKAATLIQKLFLGCLTRQNLLRRRRRERIAECATAIRSGDVSWAEQMISNKGVTVNAIDQNGWTLLHHAAANNREEVIIKLVELGADMQARDSLGNTALHIACSRKKVSAARRLVLLGADVEVCNDKGNSPFVRPRFFLSSIFNELMAVQSKSIKRSLMTFHKKTSALPISYDTEIRAIACRDTDSVENIATAQFQTRAIAQSKAWPISIDFSTLETNPNSPGNVLPHLSAEMRPLRAFHGNKSGALTDRPLDGVDYTSSFDCGTFQQIQRSLQPNGWAEHKSQVPVDLKACQVPSGSKVSSSRSIFPGSPEKTAAVTPIRSVQTAGSNGYDWLRVGTATNAAVQRGITEQRPDMKECQHFTFHVKAMAHRSQRQRERMIQFEDITRPKQSIFASEPSWPSISRSDSLTGRGMFARKI